jgi:hypothetical protein
MPSLTSTPPELTGTPPELTGTPPNKAGTSASQGDRTVRSQLMFMAGTDGLG